MSQPIDVGAVLGGRYKVTEVVLASADGDVVLDGTDQVLNRTVSILVASSANASQVATSAREIATGERYGAMQVLDLGISEGSTYLITNTAEPADLLDLVIQRDAPFVEPFYTDTLGSEIFGVSRSTEPHVYDDDDEYYEEQRAQEANRPGVMDRLPEINLSERFSGLKARFNKGRDTDGDGTGDPGAAPAAGSTDDASLTDATDAPAHGPAAASDGPPAALPPRPAGPPRRQPSPSQQPAGEDTGEIQRPPATQAQSLPPVKPATPRASDADQERGAAKPARGRTSNKVSLYDDAEPQEGRESPAPREQAEPADRGLSAAAGAAAAAAAGAAAGAAGAAAGAAGTPAESAGAGAGSIRGGSGHPSAETGAGRKASVFPAGARNYQQSSPHADPDAADDYDEDSDGGRKATRLIVGGVLALLLVFAVVFAFNNLGPRGEDPVAGDSPSSAPAESGGGGAEPTGEAEPTDAPTVAPQIAGLSRLVPGNQELNAETDATLSRAIDGNQGSMYRSYSYTQPQFGGFAANMVLVVELEEESDVSSVELSGLNGTGGAFQIRVGETDDLGAATEVTSGSFTGPTVTVPVSGDDGGPAKAQYVFINVTELPRLASSSNESRPYGLQVAEIKVS
ncbi:hypothetical protein ACX8Z9_03655 [Arthrobacter halodurans]|uniref:ABC transporter substrate-binding protein n=1 Tax=Arthrobacter halodurans TaxID=516699 RepID=A0ABV4UIX3_9MICC